MIANPFREQPAPVARKSAPMSDALKAAIARGDDLPPNLQSEAEARLKRIPATHFDVMNTFKAANDYSKALEARIETLERSLKHAVAAVELAIDGEIKTFSGDGDGLTLPELERMAEVARRQKEARG
ncbi:hypothetical protein [Falsihalocynthiibacter sp. CO-5D18]|uniref:hypothetical protein n=1 Tax=Falsihalocynthiibacter sp. CO-5D18 TaxID=3240872 RepID=UPI00350FFE01